MVCGRQQSRFELKYIYVGTVFVPEIIHVFLSLDSQCNPGLLGIVGDGQNKVTFDKTSIIGLVIWILCVLYTSLRSASKVAQVAMPDPEKQGEQQSACSDNGN